MPFGGPRAEALLAAGDELAGQRDFGHQHEHLLAERQGRGNRLEIDFGLARAGHAVEQAHAETVAGIGEQVVRGLGLLLCQCGALPREVERDVVPIGKRLGDQRAGIDQAVDHTCADTGRLGQARFHPSEAVIRRSQHAGARRRHALGRGSREPHAVTRRGRIEGAARAHHHAQDHAWRGERIARHPVGKIERDARQCRHLLNQFDDLAELLALDLRRRFALGARPHDAEIVDRPERHDDELAWRDLHAFGHEIVVRRGQRQRQHDGYRRGRFGFRRSRLGLCLGQRTLFSFSLGLTTHQRIVACSRARRSFASISRGSPAWRKTPNHPDIWGRLTSRRRSKAGLLTSPSSVSSPPTRPRPTSAMSPSSWRSSPGS